MLDLLVALVTNATILDLGVPSLFRIAAKSRTGRGSAWLE